MAQGCPPVPQPLAEPGDGTLFRGTGPVPSVQRAGLNTCSRQGLSGARAGSPSKFTTSFGRSEGGQERG